MKISLAEINSKVGDLKYNSNLIKKNADIAIKNGAEILITPELSLCGYPPEDLLLETEFIDRCQHYLIEIAEKFPKLKIIVGILDEKINYSSTQFHYYMGGKLIKFMTNKNFQTMVYLMRGDISHLAKSPEFLSTRGRFLGYLFVRIFGRKVLLKN